MYCQSKQPHDSIKHARFRSCSYDGTIEPYKLKLIGCFITPQIETKENLNVEKKNAQILSLDKKVRSIYYILIPAPMHPAFVSLHDFGIMYNCYRTILVLRIYMFILNFISSKNIVHRSRYVNDSVVCITYVL